MTTSCGRPILVPPVPILKPSLPRTASDRGLAAINLSRSAQAPS